MPPTKVRSRLLLPPNVHLGPDAVVRISIEDVTLADAPARPVAAAEFSSTAEGEALGPFELEADLAPGAGDYALRVHIDQTGDGRVTPGDFVSTARHWIFPGSDASELDVPLTRVGQQPEPG